MADRKYHEQEYFSSTVILNNHMAMLRSSNDTGQELRTQEEIKNAPLFSRSAVDLAHGKTTSQDGPMFPNFALFGCQLDVHSETDQENRGIRKEIDEDRSYTSPVDRKGETALETVPNELPDTRIFLNVNVPWSAFICGSQGSGKSHSLSCMLENCLLQDSKIGRLSKPLTGLVFHYDQFSGFGGQACEAAYLCSHLKDVRIYVSPSSLRKMQNIYKKIAGSIPGARPPKIEPLRIDSRYLNAERLMTLMAAGDGEGQMPLYMLSVLQILRDMGMDRGDGENGIDLGEFKNRLEAKNLTPAQRGPLELRLDMLRSFVAGGTRRGSQGLGNDWTPDPGKLVIVDLSCPFVDSSTVCVLFDTCLKVFLEQKSDIGRVVALDEAHKFMTDSAAAAKLTETLTTAIRLQRHTACRVIVATQEPTISTRLLDLCSVTLVHRFSSPQWFKALHGHLAAASMHKSADDDDGIFTEIVHLSTGEALLFAPSAALVREKKTFNGKNGHRGWKMNMGYLRICVRGRLTSDGGKSILAS